MQQHQYAVEMELELELRQRKESIVAARRAEANEAELEMLMVGQEDQEEVDRERIKAGEHPLGPRCDSRESLAEWSGNAGYELHAPNMSAIEARAMMQYIRGEFIGARWKRGEATYLEWGSGGSTSTYGTAAGTAFSVEHVPDWQGREDGTISNSNSISISHTPPLPVHHRHTSIPLHTLTTIISRRITSYHVVSRRITPPHFVAAFTSLVRAVFVVPASRVPFVK